MKVAVVGCCHGALNTIYALIPLDTELLLICGDFQAFRNPLDMEAALIPPKYRSMMDFHEYYSGEREAPVMTIVIGGNHESSSYLQELRFGGWLAPNIYYLGEVGAVWYRGLVIAGVLGIYNQRSFYRKAPDEQLPYTSDTVRLVYHTKPRQLLKGLLLPSDEIDVFLSHDWPSGIEHYGNTRKLIQKKPHFGPSIDERLLGLPIAMTLLKSLRPRHWCSGHLHVRYEAEYKHNESVNAHEIELNMDDDFNEDNTHQRGSSTSFLALDKPGRRRSFIGVLNVEPQPQHLGHPSLNSDQLWYFEPMARINHQVDRLGPVVGTPTAIENPKGWKIGNVVRGKVELMDRFPETPVPNDFSIVAPTDASLLQSWPNPQTSLYRQRYDLSIV